MPGPATLPELLPETDTQTRRQPPYAVVLHNDDFNGMGWVLLVLKKVFGYDDTKCMTHMTEAHETGKSVVWIGALELAELKADQIVGCGSDPDAPKAEPLRVTVEPVE